MHAIHIWHMFHSLLTLMLKGYDSFFHTFMSSFFITIICLHLPHTQLPNFLVIFFYLCPFTPTLFPYFLLLDHYIGTCMIMMFFYLFKEMIKLYILLMTGVAKVTVISWHTRLINWRWCFLLLSCKRCSDSPMSLLVLLSSILIFF